MTVGATVPEANAAGIAGGLFVSGPFANHGLFVGSANEGVQCALTDTGSPGEGRLSLGRNMLNGGAADIVLQSLRQSYIFRDNGQGLGRVLGIGTNAPDTSYLLHIVGGGSGGDVLIDSPIDVEVGNNLNVLGGTVIAVNDSLQYIARGNNTGVSNIAIYTFEDATELQTGLIGFPSPVDSTLYIANEISFQSIQLDEAGGIDGIKFDDGTNIWKIWHEGNFSGGGIPDAPADGTTYGRNNNAWVAVGGGAVTWGGITGTLSNQIDLQNALDAKGDVFKTGTPVNNEIAVFVNGNTIQGDPALEWDGLILSVSGDIGATDISALGDISAIGTVSGNVVVGTSRGDFGEIQLLPQGTSTRKWEIRSTTSSNDLTILLETGAGTGLYTQLYGLNQSGTPTNGTDLVTKAYGDSVYLGGASVAWGGITGTLSNQGDLQTALNGKLDTLNVLGNTDELAVFTGTNAVGSTTELTFDGVTFTVDGDINLTGSGQYLVNGVPIGGGSGTVTNVTVGTGLDVTNGTTTPNITVDLNELTAGGTLVATDSLVAVNGTVTQKQLISSIPLSIFNNNAGWTSNTGDITGVTAGVGLSGGGTSGTVTLTLDMSELTNMSAAMTGTDQFIVLDGGADRRKTANTIGLSIFNNDAGFTTNVGDITGVTAGTNLTGGGTSGTVTLNMATGGIGAGTYGNTANTTKIDTITVDAYGRVTAVATGPVSAGGTIGGSISNQQVAVGNGTNSIAGSNNFVWDGSFLAVNGAIVTSGAIIATYEFGSRGSRGGLPDKFPLKI